MIGWLTSLFTGKQTDGPGANEEISEQDDMWAVIERMEPRNSLARLRQLNLSPTQFPIVRGLLDGTISPDDRPGIADWCRDHEVLPKGVDALNYALQLNLESEGTTYVFSSKEEFPVAKMPKLVNRQDLSIVMPHFCNSPFLITSLDEFLSSTNVADFTLEVLDPSQLKRRVTNKPSFARDRLDRGTSESVTIEKQADDDNRLTEPFDKADLVAAVNTALETNLTPDDVSIENEPIVECGLYSCIVQVDSITKQKIKFWVVPKA
ncbi:hypothetical protein [Planctomycetes bacterium K23_9]|uniref:Uncharacterized protein n=1 Tax=Stieleria marina TaxID=1930275 RepID=A0A517NNH1_9BACT|nr:hypothetical protein K239x_06150 [Planctomycetes bacterium K23_9]